MVYCVFVHVYVKEGYAEKFIEACRRNHEGTRKEEGNRRFDVLRSTEDELVFHLYEVYESVDAFKAHQKTEHYLAWRSEVAEWMAKPRSANRANSLFPEPYA